MSEEKVILCDVCREKVARYKCAFCGKDICGGDCYTHLQFSIGNNNYQIISCKTCWDKFVSDIFYKRGDYRDFFTKEFVNEIGEKIIDYIKKGTLAKSLENGQKHTGNT
jgi:hypothetical protein